MRPLSNAELEPVPPTLRDGEARRERVSDVVPKTAVATPQRRPLAVEVESLAAIATKAFARGAVTEAHRAVTDALELLWVIGEDVGLARAELAVGRCLVGLGLADRALGVLDAAERHATAMGDLRTRAGALQVIGHALWAMGDPSCRGAFEDAGEIFEEIGDEAAMRSIDTILRDIAVVVIEESPRSFHGRRRA